VSAGPAAGSVELMLRRVRDVYLPQRQFVSARRLTAEIARQTADPVSRARALVLDVVPDVLWGNGPAAMAGLFRARELVGSGTATAVSRRIDVLELLLSHDGGAADFEARWADAAGRCAAETDVNWHWSLIRIATERGALAVAAEAARLPVAPTAGPLARQLRTLALAGLQIAVGRPDDGVRRLRPLLGGSPALSALVLPEALATAAAATAATDLEGARALVNRLDALADAGPLLAREDCLRSLAHAAVRSAEGRDAAAAGAAAAAADTAETAGLVWLGSRARELCLASAGRAQLKAGTPEARTLRLSLETA
jgi:hypothetical protein